MHVCELEKEVIAQEITKNKYKDTTEQANSKSKGK